jgi:hypothetical protein
MIKLQSSVKIVFYFSYAFLFYVCLGLKSPPKYSVILVDPHDCYGCASHFEDHVIGIDAPITPVPLFTLTGSNLALSDHDDPEDRAAIERATYRGDFEAWREENDVGHILGIFCESDTGLRLSEYLGCKILPSGFSNTFQERRRDKYLTNEAVRARGLRAVRQILTDEWKEALHFIKKYGLCEHGETKDELEAVIVKPSRGSASVGVYRAESLKSAEDVFNHLKNQGEHLRVAGGQPSEELLIQEELHGVEYVVDTVTQDGMHKVIATWRYDKRRTNGAPFVYYEVELIDSTSSGVSEGILYTLHDYCRAVLDVMEVRQGPSHVEIKLVPTPLRTTTTTTTSTNSILEPVLIEANIGRYAGFPVVDVCNACLGYNQVQLTIDAMLGHYTSITNFSETTKTSKGVSEHDGEEISAVNTLPLIDTFAAAQKRWNSIPSVHGPLVQAGSIVILSSHVEGTLKEEIPDIHAIRNAGLDSIHTWNPYYSIGDDVHLTVDLATTAGWAVMINPNKVKLKKDVQKLLELQCTMLRV